MPASTENRGAFPTLTQDRKTLAPSDGLPRRQEDARPFDDAVLSKIVSNSRLMEDVFQLVRQVASVESTVLVTGESGTGKELIAEAIHAGGPRAAGPCVTINMAAVPESLAESQLFGHVKGAFTGATANRVGCFEAAKGGTIFIDEIGDLKPPSQAKLLRVLENRVVTPVGGNVEREVDVRVVAATNRPLEHMVSSGDFREDLYYRLNVVRIALPPLRERQGDIPLLVNYFVDHFCERYARTPMRVDAGLMEFLQAHRWSGNVRELRNCVESMVVLSNSDELTMADVPPTTRRSARPHHPQFELPDGFTLAEVTQAAITQTLERCDGNRTHAANKLDISVRTLQRKLARRQADAA